MTTILIADNEAHWMANLCDLIQREGYRVIRARDPKEALAALSTNQVDLAVLDLRLRDDASQYDISGLQIAASSDPMIPKIIVSSYPSERVREEGIDSDPSIVDFLQKGDIQVRLIPAVERALRIKDELIKIAVRVLADVADEELDLLDFGDYADAIAELIRDQRTQKPLTIGIDGAWGTGKTQLMKMIRKRLRNPVSDRLQAKFKNRSGFPTVWFNAWKYDREDALWAALVLEILDQSANALSPWRGRYLKLRLKLRRVNWWSITVAGGLALFGMLAPLGIVLISRSSPILGSALLALGALSAVGAYPSLKSVFSRLKTLQQDLSKYVKTPNYQEKIGFLAQFQKDFECVIDIVTDRGKWPLVVFIDDLDRCGPVQAVEIVEAINILLDSRHCVFVLGMDSKSVAQSIQSKYKSLVEPYFPDPGGLSLGERFLEKILQINFKIPSQQEHQVHRLIKNYLGRPEVMQAAAERNERQELAKQLIQAEQRGGRSLPEATETAARTFSTSELPKEEIEKASAELSELAFEDDQAVQRAVQEAAPYLGFNPRKIKKFINNFRLYALIAQKRGLFGSATISVRGLAMAIVISMRWPDLSLRMSSDRNACATLKAGFAAQEKLQALESSESMDPMEQSNARKTLDNLEGMKLGAFLQAQDLSRLLASIQENELERFADCFNLPGAKM